LDGESLPLLVLVGPTAVGKTALSLCWAEAVGAEIISADSTTVYRRLDIGTAKPTAADRRRVPHYGVDLVEPTEQFSVADFQRVAVDAIAQIHRSGRLPLLVGGTGLFVRAVLAAYPLAPVGVTPWRSRLADWAVRVGDDGLRRRLRLVDPVSYAAIAPGDRRRTIRALEVFLATGSRLPRRPGAAPYRSLVVGLTRHPEDLRARIAARARQQLADGLQREVLDLLAAGIPPGAPGFKALGYRETVAWAYGRVADDELFPLIVRHTTQYAKRQRTWFRHQIAARWINLSETGEEAALQQMLAWTADWLSDKTLAPRSPR
jgi:tRNA dimethylallyltransferase